MELKFAWLDSLGKADPDYSRLVGAVIGKGMEKGALDPKTKALISLGIDAANGHRQGTANMAKLARSLGASNEEIREVVRLVFLSSGIPGLVTGLVAFAGGVAASEEP